MKLLFDEVKRAVGEAREIDKERISPDLAAIKKRYFEIPLAEMQAEKTPFADAVLLAADLIDQMEL